MREELQAAFVLHTRAYRETSLLLELFTESFGRIGLVARGARRPKARLRALLRPFQYLLLSWSGRGELGTLIGAEAEGAPYLVSGKRLACGFYMNELLLRLLARSDAHPRLFSSYRKTLQGLGEHDRSPEALLRVFEKHLLSELGYALLLDHEADDGPRVRAGAVYRYNLESGPVRVSETCRGERTVKGESLLALDNEQLSGGCDLLEIKRLTRAALNQYLAGKPIRARELIH